MFQKKKLIIDNNKFIIDKENTIKWKINNLFNLKENNTLESSNFKIGNTYWYFNYFIIK